MLTCPTDDPTHLIVLALQYRAAPHRRTTKTMRARPSLRAQQLASGPMHWAFHLVSVKVQEPYPMGRPHSGEGDPVVTTFGGEPSGQSMKQGNYEIEVKPTQELAETDVLA